MAKLTVYEHINFGGESLEINETTVDLGEKWRNRISSLKLEKGWKAVFYDSAAPSVSGVFFGNKSIGFEGPIEVPDLTEEGHGWFGDWNDEIVGVHLKRLED